MREIKFRGYDGADWIYGSAVRYDSYTDTWYLLENGAPDDDWMMVSGIGQYTGLKDKNGNEIFEGDIIRRDYEIGRDIIDPVSLGFVDREIEEAGYFIGLVNYRPSEGYVLNKCRKFYEEGEFVSQRSGVKIYAQYAEVIGNIYENPQLLET